MEYSEELLDNFHVIQASFTHEQRCEFRSILWHYAKDCIIESWSEYVDINEENAEQYENVVVVNFLGFEADVKTESQLSKRSLEHIRNNFIAGSIDHYDDVALASLLRKFWYAFEKDEFENSSAFLEAIVNTAIASYIRAMEDACLAEGNEETDQKTFSRWKETFLQLFCGRREVIETIIEKQTAVSFEPSAMSSKQHSLR